MALSHSEIRHVALLARLELSDDQVETLGAELNSILDHIDTIQRLDLADVEPMTHPIPMVNQTRADAVRPGLSRDVALLNAPQAEEGAFVIPRIVGGGDAS